MSEIRYPVWWEPPDDPNGDDEADRMAHIFHECDGIPGDIAIARVWDAEHARRIAAALNATKGIPTETLEAGVVVVPVEELRKRLPALIRAAAEMVLSERRKLDNDQLDEELKDQSALSQTTAKMESKLGSFIEWLSRLQQNGGEGRWASGDTATAVRL